MSDEIELGDQINHQIDQRKQQKLVEDGVITASEIANAPIFLATPTCQCDRGLEPDSQGNLRCPNCAAPSKEEEINRDGTLSS